MYSRPNRINNLKFYHYLFPKEIAKAMKTGTISKLKSDPEDRASKCILHILAENICSEIDDQNNTDSEKKNVTNKLKDTIKKIKDEAKDLNNEDNDFYNVPKDFVEKSLTEIMSYENVDDEDAKRLALWVCAFSDENVDDEDANPSATWESYWESDGNVDDEDANSSAELESIDENADDEDTNPSAEDASAQSSGFNLKPFDKKYAHFSTLSFELMKALHNALDSFFWCAFPEKYLNSVFPGRSFEDSDLSFKDSDPFKNLNFPVGLKELLGKGYSSSCDTAEFIRERIIGKEVLMYHILYKIHREFIKDIEIPTNERRWYGGIYEKVHYNRIKGYDTNTQSIFFVQDGGSVKRKALERKFSNYKLFMVSAADSSKTLCDHEYDFIKSITCSAFSKDPFQQKISKTLDKNKYKAAIDQTTISEYLTTFKKSFVKYKKEFEPTSSALLEEFLVYEKIFPAFSGFELVDAFCNHPEYTNNDDTEITRLLTSFLHSEYIFMGEEFVDFYFNWKKALVAFKSDNIKREKGSDTEEEHKFIDAICKALEDDVNNFFPYACIVFFFAMDKFVDINDITEEELKDLLKREYEDLEVSDFIPKNYPLSEDMSEWHYNEPFISKEFEQLIVDVYNHYIDDEVEMLSHRKKLKKGKMLIQGKMHKVKRI